MEFLDEATSSDIVRADVTGRRGGTNVDSELPCAGVLSLLSWRRLHE